MKGVGGRCNDATLTVQPRGDNPRVGASPNGYSPMRRWPTDRTTRIGAGVAGTGGSGLASGMKIAVLSDIHGNLAALDAVLADVETRGVDRIVNLGDICSGPLFPAETAARLIPMALPTVRGNHERQVLTLPPDRMGPSDRYAAERLTADQRAWLAALPETLWLTDEVLLVHGTPGSDLLYFLETLTPDGVRPATMDEAVERAGSTGAHLILCGHTHTPRAMRLPDGCLVVNPGSVGLPAYGDDEPFPHIVETGSPHARYAIVAKDADGWSADFIEVVYDWDAAARVARDNGRPDWERGLATGRM